MSGEETLAVGVIGVGALGAQHARVYSGLPGVRLIGVHDVERSVAQDVAQRHGCRSFESIEDLLAKVQAVSVAVPTVDHHRVARACLESGVHVLLEKPMTVTLNQADDLIATAKQRGCTLQVGHIERFNPAADALRRAASRPRFVEVHRLSPFSARSLDIDVVLDLMIHDLDVILALDGSEAIQVEAVGVPVLTPRVDIANARLRFASGLIANVTASRVSSQKVRKFRVFAPRIYISADFALRAATVYRLVDASGRPEVAVEHVSAPDEEPLRLQLAAFVRAIRDGSIPVVSGPDGRRALALAHRVLAALEEVSAGVPETPAKL